MTTPQTHSKMNILGISGSPHVNGNTSRAVQTALALVDPEKYHTKYISLANRNISSCIGCFKCAEKRECIFDDGMNEIYEALRWCDGLIIGSPVYFGMVSGQLKTMMDRCVVFRPSYDLPLELTGKIGCGIACGAFRNGGQETTLQNIHTFLLQQNMKTISDGYSFSHAGATIVGETDDDQVGLQTIRNQVKNLMLMMEK